MKYPCRFTTPMILAVALLLAACQTMQTAATSPDYAKTRKGAGIGAAAGAVIGLLAGGDKLQNAMIGAAVGGIAGGAIGNYQDRQEAKLREQMSGSGVDVVRKDDNITLNMPSGITFATESSDLNADFYPVLSKVADSLNEYDQTVIEIVGYTDSTGSREYNQALSERRAQTVASYLTSHGVKSQRLIITGEGEDKPVASNNTPAGRQQNRRVEMTIVPVEKKG